MSALIWRRRTYLFFKAVSGPQDKDKRLTLLFVLMPLAADI